ncbi:MAG: substrate-binding domain-containing protein, partial [Bacillota bacterium]
EKIKGYKKALHKYNIKIDNNLINEGKEEKDIYELINDVLIKQDKKVDGIITSSDSLALKTIKVLNQLKFNIPKDISIIGFDNINSAKNTNPPLTTVHQQKLKLGIKSVNMLTRKIQKKEVKSNILSTGLIIRDSVMTK